MHRQGVLAAFAQLRAHEARGLGASQAVGSRSTRSLAQFDACEVHAVRVQIVPLYARRQTCARCLRHYVHTYVSAEVYFVFWNRIRTRTQYGVYVT